MDVRLPARNEELFNLDKVEEKFALPLTVWR